MRLENCKKGVKVQFATKSTGQSLYSLKGTRNGVIDYIGGEIVTVRVYIGTRNYTNSLNFLPSDLAPLKEGGINA